MIQGSVSCGSFKRELMLAIHDLANDQLRIALYEASAELDVNTTAYLVPGEITGTGYTAGGQILTGGQVLLDPVTNYAYATFNDPIWEDSVITARGALIYNQSKQQRAVAVIDFGVDRVSNHGPFRVAFPPVGPATALIRIY